MEMRREYAHKDTWHLAILITPLAAPDLSTCFTRPDDRDAMIRDAVH